MSMTKVLFLHILRNIPLRYAGLLVSILLLLWPFTHVWAVKQSDEHNSLVRFLENVPDVTQIYTDPVPVNYVNYRYAQDGCGLSGIDNAAALQSLNDERFQQWSECLGRIQTFVFNKGQRAEVGLLQFHQLAPELTAELLARKVPGAGSMFRDLPERLGIDWFEIDQSLVFGVSPYTAVLLGYKDGIARTASISPVLEKAGFRSGQANGLQVWRRFDDLEIRESAALPLDKLGRISSDPFGIAHGYGLTLIEKPGVLGGSRSSEITKRLAATWEGGFQNILQVSSYRAAAEAVSNANKYDGVLIQSLFLGTRYTPEQVSLMRLGPYVSDEQRRTYADELKQRNPAPLDPYQLIVLADRQEADEGLLLLGLVFNNRSSAEYAAKVLPQLVMAYTPIEYGVPLPELIDFGASADVFQGQPGAPYVAVLAMRSSGNDTKGKLFEIFSSGFRHRDLDILVTLHR